MRRATPLAGPQGPVLVSNDLGDYAILSRRDHAELTAGRLGPQHARYLDLEARSLLDHRRAGRGLEAAVARTRKAFALDGPTLHIFVVTLRCDHACQYCQVSRASLNATEFDMSRVDALAGVDRLFETPGKALTVEFQGGEPGLRFDLVREIVEAVEARNLAEDRDIRFTMTSTLHHLDGAALAFCRDHGIHLTTSLDGPAELHDAHRPNPGRDAWRRTVEGLACARDVLGMDGVAALPTITRAALADPLAVIDAYRALGFSQIFLRPISPFGFARRTRRAIGYDMPAFLAFYETALDYILALNRQGEAFTESFAAVLLRHILTPFHSGYMDLRSPTGAGLGVLVYNYDGQVYPSDEARMAAETGDRRFALGSVHAPLDQLMASPAMAWLMTGAVAEDLPGCRDCAFVPFCGADPVYHAAVQGDPMGERATSEFCQRHIGVFRMLFQRLDDADEETHRTFLAWALRRPRASIMPGFIER